MADWREEGADDAVNSPRVAAESRYTSFMDSLVPVNAESAGVAKPIGEEIDLGKILQKFENNGAGNNQVIPVDIDELSEPDDDEIQKMILTDEEKALKTRLWNTLNQDWISQEKEKKKARKAQRKIDKALSHN